MSAIETSPWSTLGAAGERLARIAEGARIAPAYLFEASDATGPREGARLFAAALLCQASPRPCLACSSCRRVRSGSHPDVHRRGRDKATVISVEALAALLERAHASPREGRRQVFVIDPADAMAPEAVARYLKSLEEPPETTTFVLVTTRPERLPDAVLSRCQRVRFPDPTAETIAARLRADASSTEGAPLDARRAALVARWANGSYERARRLAAIEADRVVETLATAALGRVSAAATAVEATIASLRARAGATDSDATASGGEEPAPDAAPGERLREAVTDVLHALAVACRDRAAGISSAAMACAVDESSPTADILSSLSPDRAAGALERIGSLSALVRRNVAPAALLLDATLALRSGR